MKNILIIGTTSFIGNNFSEFLKEYDNRYNVDKISVRDDSWRNTSFKNYDSIIHLAAIVHQPAKSVNCDVYDEVNHQLAFELAKKAKEDGVKQFVFLSTINVYGVTTGYITKDTPTKPNSPYACSKALAEQAIQQLSSSDYQVAIIRAPMVYGVGNKGNYNILSKFALSSPVFPKVNNQISAIFVSNLCEFMKQVIDKNLQGILFPQNEKYMNTSETVYLIAKAHSKNIFISKILGLGIKPLMFSSIVQKAFGSLTYDSSLPGGPNLMEYNIVSFEDSIRLTEKK